MLNQTPPTLANLHPYHDAESKHIFYKVALAFISSGDLSIYSTVAFDTIKTLNECLLQQENIQPYRKNLNDPFALGDIQLLFLSKHLCSKILECCTDPDVKAWWDAYYENVDCHTRDTNYLEILSCSWLPDKIRISMRKVSKRNRDGAIEIQKIIKNS